jgi:hypothetical protein
MAAIEIFLTSRWDNAGTQAARQDIQRIAADIAGSIKGIDLFGAKMPGGGSIFGGISGDAAEGVANTAQLGQELGLVSAELAEMIRQITVLEGAGLTEEILEAAGAFAQLTEEEKAAAKAAQQGAEQTAAAQEQQAVTAGKVIKGLQQRKALTDALANSMSSLTRFSTAELFDFGKGTTSADEFTNKLLEVAEGQRRLAETAQAVGLPQVAAAFRERAAQAENLARKEGTLAEREREAARAARENAQAQQVVVQSLRDRFRALNQLSSVDILAGIPQEIKGTKELNKFLDQQVKIFKRLAEARRRAGEFDLAARMEKFAQQLKNAAKEAGGLSDAERRVAENAQELTGFFEQFGITGEMSGQQAKQALDGIITSLEQQQKQAASSRKAMEFGEQISQAKSFRSSIDQSAAAVGQFGQETGILGTIMQSSFNQLGFVMFITENTIKSIINKFKLLFDTIREGGQQIESMNAFAAATERAGVSARQLTDSVQEQAQGLISIQAMQAASVRLESAGAKAALEHMDAIAQGAVAIALRSGNAQEAENIFKKMTDAVAKGTATTLDLNGVIIDLSTAQDRINILTEEYGRDLDDLETKQIVWEEMSRQIAANIRLTEGLEPAIGSLNESTESMSQKWADVKTTFGFFADIVFSGLSKIKDAIGGIAAIAGGFAAIFSPALGVVAGAVAGGITAIDNFKQVLLALSDAGIVVFAVLGSGFAAIRIIIDNTIQQFRKLLEVGDAVRRLEFDEAKQHISEMGQIAEDSVDAILGIPEAAIEVAGQLHDEIKTALGLFEDTDVDITPSIDTSFFDKLRESLEFVLSDERQFSRDLEKINEDHGERVAEIWERFRERIEKIQEQSHKRMREAEEDFADKIEDINEDLADKLDDINADLDKKIERLEEDSQDRREKAISKSNKRKEKIEKDFQKKIRDIQRRFELAALKALIDRDARALFEAQMRRDEDIRKAKEDAEEKKQNEIDNLRDMIDEINREEEKRKRRAREDAEDRRKEAKEAWKDQIDDAVEAMEDLREEIREQLEEQLLEANKARDKDLKNAEKAKNKRIKQLKEEFKERKLIEEATTALQKLEAERQRFITARQTGDLLNELDSRKDALLAYMDIWALVASVTGQGLPALGGGGGGGFPFDGDGDGDGGGPVGPPCADVATIPFIPRNDFANPDPCSPEGITGIAPDCSRWTCFDGGWRIGGAGQGEVQGAPQGQAQGAPQGTGQGPMGAPIGGGLIGVGGGGSGRIPVTINVENDETLREIFKSISYEAFVEITG